MGITPYASGFGSIMYGMICSRSDLTYVNSIVSWFVINMGQVQWEDSKWVMRYFNSSLKGGLNYTEADQEKKQYGWFCGFKL